MNENYRQLNDTAEEINRKLQRDPIQDEEISVIKTMLGKAVYSPKAVISATARKTAKNAISLSSINIVNSYGQVETIRPSVTDFIFGDSTGYILAANNGSVVYRADMSHVEKDDIILASYYKGGDKFIGGYLLPYIIGDNIEELANSTNERLNSIKEELIVPKFNQTLVGMGDDVSGVRFLLEKDRRYRISIFKQDWTFSGYSSVVARFRPQKNGVWGDDVFNCATIESVKDYYEFKAVESDFYSLYVRADVGHQVPFLIFDVTNDNSGVMTPDAEARNTHIALMNKYAERYGCSNSTFGGSYGLSIVTAKDFVKLGIAAFSNNVIASFWGKRTYSAPILNANRVDFSESTYTDVTSHPDVHGLADYYFIYGGKTGSSGTAPKQRNLVVAVKSKVDNAVLVGCVLYANIDTPTANRYTIIKQLFDALEEKRNGGSADVSSLNCNAAYAVVLSDGGNLLSNIDNIDNLIHVGKSEDAPQDSHSIAKLATMIVAAQVFKQDRVLTIDGNEDYYGTSGVPEGRSSRYDDKDQLYAYDMMASALLVSGSQACQCMARYIGYDFASTNGYSFISFRLCGHTAYAKPNTKWQDWIGTADCKTWMQKTGKTISMSGNNVVCNGTIIYNTGTMTYNDMHQNVNKGDNILANNEYSSI